MHPNRIGITWQYTNIPKKGQKTKRIKNTWWINKTIGITKTTQLSRRIQKIQTKKYETI